MPSHIYKNKPKLSTLLAFNSSIHRRPLTQNVYKHLISPMEDNVSFDSLCEIQSQLDSLMENYGVACECDKHLEIKIRYFGNGKHFVKQCNACGEQRGGSLKSTDAIVLLAGALPREFNPSIEEARRLKSQILNERISELSSESKRLKLALYGQPDWSSLQLVEQEKHEKAAAHLYQNVNALVEQFGVASTVGFLVREMVRLKKSVHDDFKQNVHRFSSEAELKDWFEYKFSKDFIISREVKGRHLAEDVPVRIDYLLRARPHLINAGFETMTFGVEVKYFRQEEGFTHKTSRGIWQAISYNDCEFYVEESTVKPKFCLIFSNLSFEDELQLVKSFGFEFENDKFEWRGMLHLANHANVGCLNVKGARDQYRGWEMRFVGGIYFSCSIFRECATYSKSNVNVINKVRIGNF